MAKKYGESKSGLGNLGRCQIVTNLPRQQFIKFRQYVIVENGKTINEYVREAVFEKLEREGVDIT